MPPTVWGAPDCPEGLVPGIGKIFVEKTIDLSLLCTFDGSPGCRENLFLSNFEFSNYNLQNLSGYLTLGPASIVQHPCALAVNPP